jgi:HK97 gp10 family phage protein
MSLSIGVTTTVDTGGIDELIAKYALIPALIEKYADMAVALIRQYARVDTGEMRDSAKRVLEAWAAEISVGEGLPDARAIFNEYGSVHMAAQPMVRPAMEQIAAPFFAELAALLG